MSGLSSYANNINVSPSSTTATTAADSARVEHRLHGEREYSPQNRGGEYNIQGSAALNSSRPEDNIPTGDANLHDHKPTVGDKIVGKTEQMVGSVMRDPELKARGELKAMGGEKSEHQEAMSAAFAGL